MWVCGCVCVCVGGGGGGEYIVVRGDKEVVRGATGQRDRLRPETALQESS